MNEHCKQLEAMAEEESECCKAGMCVCSAEGKAFKRKVNKLLTMIKKVCPVGSHNRKDLASAKLVVRYIGLPKDATAADVSMDEANVENWYCIGLQYFQQCEPTCWKVVQADDPAEAPSRR